MTRFQTDRILKVAAYCRVSTDSSDQANSLASQQSYFKEYIERNPMWELYDIYVDEGITGTSTKKRKAFNRMMVDAQLKKYDLIITKEISRFARNTLDSIYYTRKLKEYGIGVIFANDNLFTLDPDAELRLTIMASIAQEESRKTSERVKWGQKRRMEQGVVFGKSMIGYDVRDGKLYINPEGAEIVRKIFHKYTIERKGTCTIARELKEEGIPTFTNKNWTNTVILRTLRNEKYCGDLVQKKTLTPNYLTHEKVLNRGEEEFVIIRDHHEPIISRELFELTQKELERRSPSDEQKKKLGNRYCFSGKITCEECGSSFVFHNKKLMSGNYFKYWQCYNRRQNGKTKHIDSVTGKEVGCSIDHIAHDDLKNIMTSVIEMMTADKSRFLSLLKKQLEEVFLQSDNNDFERKKEQFDKKTERRKALVDLYLDKCITREEFKEMSVQLDGEIESLKTELQSCVANTLDREKKDEIIAECVAYAKAILSSGENNDEFIKQILESMTVSKDNIITVKLNLLPFKWKFALSSVATAAGSSFYPKAEQYAKEMSENDGKNVQRDHSTTDVPMSVRSPFNSSNGIAKRWLR